MAQEELQGCLNFQVAMKTLWRNIRSPTVQKASLACMFLVSSLCANLLDETKDITTVHFSFLFTYVKGLLLLHLSTVNHG